MAFHDNVGLRLALGNVALRHLAPLNDIRLRQVRLYRGRILCERCLDIKERCKHFIFDLHRFGSRTGSFLRFRSDDGHAVAEHQRWGWMTQMYSVRSRESWGIGDYGDLKRLLADAAEKSKADFMLINPIHAGAPIPPLEPSPYLPESRRFLNVTYIRPQDIPEYATLPADVRAQVDAAVARAEGKEGPSVLYLRATGSSCKVKNSENSVLGEMLAALGCVNIADSDASLLEELSMEAILAADPERIFIVMQGSDQEKVRQTLESAVLSNPAWQQLSAVKNGRVYYMDQQLYNLKPNARWGEAYEKLAEILYGEA